MASDGQRLESQPFGDQSEEQGSISYANNRVTTNVLFAKKQGKWYVRERFARVGIGSRLF